MSTAATQIKTGEASLKQVVKAYEQYARGDLSLEQVRRAVNAPSAKHAAQPSPRTPSGR